MTESWISLNKSGNTGPLRNRSDFNGALSTLSRLHQESGERQLQAHAILEVSATASVIEFFLQLVAMEWFPGGVHNNSTKVDK